MQTNLIRNFLQYSTLFLLLCLLSACQTLPQTTDIKTVLAAALKHDDVMTSDDMQKLDAIEAKLSENEAITETEAVIYALKHNAAFNAQLVDLKIASSDLVTTGLIPNPELLFSFGVSNKPYRYAIDFPLELLWQRPIKIRKMKNLADATALQLTQSGLDLIKAVRMAYAETVLAEETLIAMQAEHQLATDIVTLSEKRLDFGDISSADLIKLQQTATQSELDKERAVFNLAIKKAALRYQLGLDSTFPDPVLSPALLPACEATSIASLQSISVAQRPDVLAAEQAVRAAEEQVKLSKVSWFKFLGSADATSGEKTGHELSPTIRTTVPIANRNKGAVSRAAAELEKAHLNLTTTKQKALLATQQAHLQYQQSCHEWQTHQSQMLPTAAKSNELVKLAYQDGEVSYLDTLQSQRTLSLAELTSIRLKNIVINQWAELRRNVSENNDVAKDIGAQKNDE